MNVNMERATNDQDSRDNLLWRQTDQNQQQTN